MPIVHGKSHRQTVRKQLCRKIERYRVWNGLRYTSDNNHKCKRHYDSMTIRICVLHLHPEFNFTRIYYIKAK